MIVKISFGNVLQALHEVIETPPIFYIIYVGDERTSGPFFWNFWEDPQFFSLDFLL